MTSSLPTDQTMAPVQAVALARLALEKYWECFWFRSDNAPLQTSGDVDLVIRRLRQYGGRAAWDFAYQIEQCL